MEPEPVKKMVKEYETAKDKPKPVDEDYFDNMII